MSMRETGSKALIRCFLLLLFVMPLLLTAHPVNSGLTAYQEISVTSYGNYTNVPITITTTYKIQLIDPITGAVVTLYPNRVVSLPDGNTAVTGYTSINALNNTFTFILIANLTEGTHNYRIIFDSTLMQNSTPIYTPVAYMKPHVINPAPGAGTGYQIRIKVHYGSGVDYGENVYLNGKCRSDFADIRFYGEDMTTPLPYWIQEKEDGNYAIFWVKVYDDLSLNPAIIYIYYGNSSLTTTTSNGTATFIFFDDFESYGDGSDINNQGGWITKKVGTGGEAKVRTVNGKKYLHLHGGSSSASSTVVVRQVNIPNSVAFVVYEFADDWDQCLEMAFGDGNIDVYGQVYNGYDIAWWNGEGSFSTIRKYVGGSLTILATISDIDSNYVFHTLEFRWYGNSLKAFRDEREMLSATDTTFSSRSHIHLMAWAGSSRYVDWVFIRKYVNPEPSHGAWGPEYSTVNISVTCGRINTESELTVRIPRMTFQEVSINASLNWPAPENANDVMKLIAESEWGRYALVVLPLFVMLVAGSRHTAGVAGGVATGLCIGVNYMVGAELYSTLILSWIGAVCLLLIIYEAKRGG